MSAPPAASSPAFAALAAEERALKHFLYARLYDLPELKPVRIEAERVVAGLAAAYRDDPSLLPEPWQRGGDRASNCAPSATSSPE